MKWRMQGSDERAQAPRPGERAGQRGNLVLGMIIGLLVGLAIALAVALWVTKVPVPFVNKVPQRTSDATEAERNKNWDPNAPLAGKNPPSRGSASTAAAAAPGAAATSATTPGAAAAPPSGAAPAQTTTGLPPYVPPMPPPLTGAAPGPAAARPPAAAVAANTPSPTAAGTAAAKPAAAGADPFVYFVQAGAYTKVEDAEQQRARLAMLGFAAKVSEREQVGRTMYRVRLGPFDGKDSAEAAQAKLQQSSIDAALVRVERSSTAAVAR